MHQDAHPADRAAPGTLADSTAALTTTFIVSRATDAPRCSVDAFINHRSEFPPSVIRIPCLISYSPCSSKGFLIHSYSRRPDSGLIVLKVRGFGAAQLEKTTAEE